MVLEKLFDFVKQSPGIERGNYATTKDYLVDRSLVDTDLKYFKDYKLGAELLGITDGDLLANAPNAWGGRLSWDIGNQEWNYTPGQYYPIEYRAAACCLLRKVIDEKRDTKRDSA